MPDTDLASDLTLSLVPGVGPRLRQLLVGRFGSARAVLAASAQELRSVQGVGMKLSHAICRATDEIDAEKEINLCRQHDIRILTLEHEDYPRMLQEIPDPPPLLFVRGELQRQDAVSVAMVGTRHATSYGLKQAERLAAGLAKAGLTIISGLARGIDAAAHEGALSAEGRTLAVLGSGLLNLYPPENAPLADRIARSGAVLSELSPTFPPISGAFPQRNRIVSGLSLGVIVVEAPPGSGSLITARHALEQGREVFAIPGRIDQRSSRGCHRLIRDGARLVDSIDDVLEELGPLIEATPSADGRELRHPAELQLNDLERSVLDRIEVQPVTIDQVIATSGLAAPQVLATISVLEMRRLIRRVSGNLVARI